jgi:predicted transcriptional regulator of viral defense system
MRGQGKSETGPSWPRLYESAAAQEGYFTTFQAAEAGYSPQLLAKHLRSGRIARIRRSVYRLVHFPAGEHEDLMVVWLWSEQQGVYSHETALALFGLSDAMPRNVHLTLPGSWGKRRLRIPPGVALHYADIRPEERSWVGPVPVTSPVRTLLDCAAERVAPDIVRQAVDEGLRRGLFDAGAIEPAVQYVQSFAGRSR